MQNIQAGMTENDLAQFFGLNEDELHRLVKDGGELPFGECPECRNNTFVFDLNYCTTCDDEIEPV